MDEDALPDAVGTYQPCTLLLEKALFEDLLDEPLPEGFTTRKEGAQGEQRSVVEVSLERLEHLPKLKTWYASNAHHLKGHPKREELSTPPQDVGVYLPKTVTLPKRIVTELLGEVPEDGKPTRPTLDGKRPHLIALELPSEAP